MNSCKLLLCTVSLLLTSALQGEEKSAVVRAIERKDWTQLRKMKNVTELNLRGVRIEDDELLHLAQLPDIKILELQGSFLDGGITNLITDRGLLNLGGLQQLEVLRLDGQAITTLGTKYLRAFPRLRELEATTTSIGYRGRPDLKDLKTLKVLKLGSVTPETVAEIAELKQLERLEINASRLDDDSLAALAGLSQLKTLVLDDFWTPGSPLEYVASLNKLSVERRYLYALVRLTDDLQKEYARLDELQSIPRLIAITATLPTGRTEKANTIRRAAIRDLESQVRAIIKQGRHTLETLCHLADKTYELAQEELKDEPKLLVEVEKELRRCLKLGEPLPPDAKRTRLAGTGFGMTFPGQVKATVGKNGDTTYTCWQGNCKIVAEVSRQEEPIPVAFLVVAAAGEAGLYNGQILSQEQSLYRDKYPAANVTWTFRDEQEGLGFRVVRLLAAKEYMIRLIYMSPTAVPTFASRPVFDSLTDGAP